MFLLTYNHCWLCSLFISLFTYYFILFLDILSGRSLEHGILARTRTHDCSRQAPGHYSTFEEGMENLFRLQSEQVLRSGPSPASYHRRKGGRKRSQVRRSDSCHLDPLDQRIPNFFSCRGKIQLFKVFQGLASCRRMDQHPNWSRDGSIENDLLYLYCWEESLFYHKLETLRIWECSSVLI